MTAAPLPRSGVRQRPARPARRCRQLANAVAALAVGNLVVTACDYDDYPVEASFCDDWCHTLRRTACDQEPENCVRDCERALPSAACFERQVTLLDCYRATPSEQLVCVEQGFQGEIRPMPEICRAERDALITCEAPDVQACIDVCRELDAADPVSAPAELEAACPVSPVPCERLCWTIQQLASADALATLSAANPGASLTLLGAPLLDCLHSGARRCWDEALLPAEEGERARRVSWTSLFFECAEPFLPDL